MSLPVLFTELLATCAAQGMNLLGVVDAADFDAAQPAGRRIAERRRTCDTVLVLGSGGSQSFARVKAAAGGALRAPHPRYHPIDDWSRAIARGVATRLADAGHACEVALPFGRDPLNFRKLAESAGLGVVSPVIGHLLHPQYGPWVSLRAAILIDGRPFGAVVPAALDFDPCSRCARPCTTACPVSVYRSERDPDFERCARHRLAAGCPEGCCALHACPIGSEHRYSVEEEDFRNRYSLFTIKRWLGVGKWALVPPGLRRRL